MSAVNFVEDASAKARWLINKESRGPGDTRQAMDRLSRRYGVPFAALWALRYRPPKDMMVSVYFALVVAYDAELERQAKLIEHERTLTTPKTWIGRVLVRAADTLDGSHTEPLSAHHNDRGAK